MVMECLADRMSVNINWTVTVMEMETETVYVNEQVVVIKRSSLIRFEKWRFEMIQRPPKELNCLTQGLNFLPFQILNRQANNAQLENNYTGS